ncbi:MAG: hypothetical protein ACOZQL_39880 [Myxococcota bacterium]
MTSLLVAVALSAWPLPADAGREAFADPANWPAEPSWTSEWPLLSFSPPGWGAGDAGVGMSIDRAWSVTRGAPELTIAVVGTTLNLSDPLVAGAWKLNAGELPDAGDVNGNGRLDVGDFAGRVPDVNANGGVDLEDLLAARADGLDQDQNGRVDDLCGWDLVRDAGPLSTADAGVEPWRLLVAPVNDGLEGIGVCPECTIVPWVAGSLDDALRAPAQVVLLPADESELSAFARARLDGGLIVVTVGSGTRATWPLALHEAVLSPRTLTATADRASATSREGCGGAALGTSSTSTTRCAPEAAARLAGLAALVLSRNPALTPTELAGLLGGPRVDAHHAVLAAPEPRERFSPTARAAPSLATPASLAEACALEGLGPVSCAGGTPLDPPDGVAWFVERKGALEWATPLVSPPLARRRGLQGLDALGPGSGPPRYVDLAGGGSESVLVASIDGLHALAPQQRFELTPPLAPGRFPIAVADVDGDQRSDFVTLGADGLLEAYGATGRPLSGFPEQLSTPPAGPPVTFASDDGVAVVTLTRSGTLTWRRGSRRWSAQLDAPQTSSPAVGFIDADPFPDLALADGREVHVLLTDAAGPRPESWTAPSRATEALLADLVGDAALEVIAEQVFDATGQPLLVLDGWTPSVVPAALSRVAEGSRRALFQVEQRTDGRFELTRYDVERALRNRDAFVSRRVLQVLTGTPSPGGFAMADVTGDRVPDVLLPTLEGELLIIDAEGVSPPDAPYPTWGTVVSAPALGVRDDQLEFAVRTTRGDVVRWLARGLVEDLTWESAGHDPGNTRNAEVALPRRHLGGLGITEPPKLAPTCGCGPGALPPLAGLLFLFRRRRRSC